MTSVTLTDPAVGSLADANLIASNNAALRTVINGNIDQSNIATSSQLTINKLTLSDASKVALAIASANGGLTIGGDTNLYRSTADTLRTDDNFIVAGNLTVLGTITGSGGGGGGGGSEPVGAVVLFAGTVVPAGWLLCDGSPVSRATYNALFASIGVTYGLGDGSTTFNLPDLQGRVPIGKGTHGDVNALGNSDGISAVANRRPRHNHNVGQPAISAPTLTRTTDVAMSGSGFTLPNHTHSFTSPTVNDPGHDHPASYDNGSSHGAAWSLLTGDSYDGTNRGNMVQGAYTGITLIGGSVGNPTSNPAIGGTVTVSQQPTFLASAPIASGTTVGPQTGAEPTDGPAYLVLSYIIKT